MKIPQIHTSNMKNLQPDKVSDDLECKHWRGISFGNNPPNKDEISHFEDDPRPQSCNSPNHNPPNMMVIPQGKIYVHICKNCGYRIVLRPSNFTL